MATFMNLTPHDIHLMDSEGNTLRVFKASGIIARVSTDIETVDVIDNVPITSTRFGEVEISAMGQTDSFPEPFKDWEGDTTYYIVSSLVAQRLRDRNDVLIPNESVRDSNGRIIGCRSLGRI